MKKENLLRKYVYLEIKRQDADINEEDAKLTLESIIGPLETLVNKLILQSTNFYFECKKEAINE